MVPFFAVLFTSDSCIGLTGLFSVLHSRDFSKASRGASTTLYPEVGSPMKYRMHWRMVSQPLSNHVTAPCNLVLK